MLGDLLGDLLCDCDFGPGMGGRCFANILLVVGPGRLADEPPVGRGFLTTSPEGSGLRGGFGAFVSLANPKEFCSLDGADGRAVLPGMAEAVEALFDSPRITASRLGLDVFRVTIRRFFGGAPGILSRFDGCDSTLGLFDAGTPSPFSGLGRLASTPA